MNAFRLAAGGCLLLVGLAYANHWHNVFHFDDEHTIVQNPNIRQLSSLPRLFTDATSASIFPTHSVYRPLTYVTLAVDYAAAGGLRPTVFHLSTFLGFLGVIGCVFVLCSSALDATETDPGNRWWALGAATLFGVHPAGAQTVNYIIQRAELWSAFGVVASTAIFAARPERRRTGLFLLPGVLGIFFKTIASIFPFTLLAYSLIVERRPMPSVATPGDRPRPRWAPFVAALLASAGATIVVALMTFANGTFDAGAPPAAQYRWTQPWIVARYLRSFFLPIDLSLDPGWAPLASPWEWRALIGYGVVVSVIAAAIWLARRRATATVSFGLAWFLITLFPVTVFPLAEVTNDHRMFLPFIGLVVATAGLGRLASVRGWLPRRAAIGVATAVLLVAATVTWQRNTVWASDLSAWQDAAAKNPENGRAVMNYGVALMQRGQYAAALEQFERAAPRTPNYDFLEVNLGIVKGALGRTQEAEGHFKRAIALNPITNVGHFYYGRWLDEQRRYAEAVWYLERAVALHADDMRAYDELIAALTAHRAYGRLREVASATLLRAPDSAVAKAALDTAQRELAGLDALRTSVRTSPSADRWLDLSLRLYNVGDFRGSIDAARDALTLRPAFAEAFNNLAAAHNALGQWDEGIVAARRALALNPELVLARNNLAWALAQSRTAR